MYNKTALFNLQAVLKETNLKPDVLRAWERRYGLPTPERTSGGHRLYSEYDIATIKWLRARQDEGLSISRAVELWMEIAESGRDPLGTESPLIVAEEQPGEVEKSRIDLLRSKWLSACLSFDALGAEDMINQAFALYPVETVCFDILQKGISEIGHMWFEGRVSVQQEHFATALAMRRIETLLSVTPRPTREKTILVGCPSGEWHHFPTLLLALLLRRKGLNVIYLGADTPLEAITEAADGIHPDLIVMAAQQLASAAAIRTAAVVFKQGGIPMAYGGLIFNRIPELRGKIPAFYLGENLEMAVGRIELLLESPAAIPNNIPVEETNTETARLFREKMPYIETRLMNLLKEEVPTSMVMPEVNTFFGTEISAALELGSPHYVEPDLDWLKHLLPGRQLPATLLLPYLTAYRRAVQLEMGDGGSPITKWLAAYLSKIQTA